MTVKFSLEQLEQIKAAIAEDDKETAYAIIQSAMDVGK